MSESLNEKLGKATIIHSLTHLNIPITPRPRNTWNFLSEHHHPNSISVPLIEPLHTTVDLWSVSSGLAPSCGPNCPSKPQLSSPLTFTDKLFPTPRMATPPPTNSRTGEQKQQQVQSLESVKALLHVSVSILILVSMSWPLTFPVHQARLYPPRKVHRG